MKLKKNISVCLEVKIKECRFSYLLRRLIWLKEKEVQGNETLARLRLLLRSYKRIRRSIPVLIKFLNNERIFSSRVSLIYRYACLRLLYLLIKRSIYYKKHLMELGIRRLSNGNRKLVKTKLLNYSSRLVYLTKRLIYGADLLWLTTYMDYVLRFWVYKVSRENQLSICNVSRFDTSYLKWCFEMHYVVFSCMLRNFYSLLRDYSDKYFWLYRVAHVRKKPSRILKLLRWNNMRGWRKKLFREFELYSARFGRQFHHLNKKYFTRDQLRSFYGIDTYKEYKNLIKKLSKYRYNIKNGGALSGFLSIFELRLATLVYRLHFVERIGDAKVAIERGMIQVNQHVIKNSNYILKVGDMVSVCKESRMFLGTEVSNNLKHGLLLCGIPSYVVVNYNVLSGVVWRTLNTSDVGYPAEVNIALLGGDLKSIVRV